MAAAKFWLGILDFLLRKKRKLLGASMSRAQLITEQSSSGLSGQGRAMRSGNMACFALEKESGQFRNMLAKNERFLETGISILSEGGKEPYQDDESPKGIEELPSISLVTSLHSLADNLDRSRE